MLDKALAPKTVTPKEWRRLTNQQRSGAHAGLGLAAFKLNQMEEAVKHFEKAIAASETPAPAALFRLAVLYRLERREQEATRLFLRVVHSGDPALKLMAEEELRR